MIKSWPLLLALLVTTPSFAEPSDVKVSTKGGLKIATEDGAFSFKLGGRLMWDTDNFDRVLNQAGEGDRRFNTQLRRSRLEMSGTLYSVFDYVFDIDYKDSTNETEIHAAGLTYTGWEHASLFIGRGKEPFGLEELASSKSISSIERNYFTEATDTDSQSHFGVRVDGNAGHIGWSVGVFSPNGQPQKRDGSDRLAYTGRVFGTLINNDTQTLHLGLAATDRNLDAPETQSGFKLDIAESGGKLDSNSILIDDDRQFGLEGLFINGPWSVQSEYFAKRMGGANGGPDGEVNEYYIQGTWTVTGERRGYKSASGVPDIIKPKGPKGAIELVAKYDHIAFDVDGQDKQTAAGFLLGANWYVNPNIKLMFNWIQVDSNRLAAPGAPEDADVFSTRIQIAF